MMKNILKLSMDWMLYASQNGNSMHHRYDCNDFFLSKLQIELDRLYCNIGSLLKGVYFSITLFIPSPGLNAKNYTTLLYARGVQHCMKKQTYQKVRLPRRKTIVYGMGASGSETIF